MWVITVYSQKDERKERKERSVERGRLMAEVEGES